MLSVSLEGSMNDGQNPLFTADGDGDGNGTENATSPAFESLLGELEGIVEGLEGGDLSLEDSLQAFERGMALSKQASARLDDAELRIERLVASADGDTTEGLDI